MNLNKITASALMLGSIIMLNGVLNAYAQYHTAPVSKPCTACTAACVQNENGSWTGGCCKADGTVIKCNDDDSNPCLPTVGCQVGPWRHYDCPCAC
jgi:hypothetical protein